MLITSSSVNNSNGELAPSVVLRWKYTLHTGDVKLLVYLLSLDEFK